MRESIRRRCVIYFSGFDPSGAAHYHRKYKLHAAQQSALSGYQLEVGNRHKEGSRLSTWVVKFTPSPSDAAHTGATQTDYIFALWDDIIRTHWGRLDTVNDKFNWLKKFIAAQWFYIQDGALLRMLKLSWPPVVALIAPLILLIMGCGIWLASPLAIWFLLNTNDATSALSLQIKLLCVALGWALLSLLLSKLVRSLEAKFHMLWLMHSYIFTHRLATQKVPDLELRLQEFGLAIRNALHSELYDEVLVVGHSSGAIMATSALAYAINATPTSSTPSTKTQLSLVTLGQCIPLLSSISMANAYRIQLASLAQTKGLTWIDFCAPSDGCSFAFVDVTIPADNMPAHYCSSPKMLSPKMHNLFSAQDYQQLCKNRFDLHFQYVHSSKLVGDYDYFNMTAGPLSLKARYGHMPSVNNYQKFKLFK
jgi:hypothetical protein